MEVIRIDPLGTMSINPAVDSLVRCPTNRRADVTKQRNTPLTSLNVCRAVSVNYYLPIHVGEESAGSHANQPEEESNTWTLWTQNHVSLRRTGRIACTLVFSLERMRIHRGILYSVLLKDIWFVPVLTCTIKHSFCYDWQLQVN